VEAAEARAKAAEKRVAHLASLLSESETENGRLAQLAEVLKEEIRSYQRAEERKRHIDNLEYVKNVIFKFVTLPGNDEKLRLVPVLTTILKLSPAEVQQIQTSIQGTIRILKDVLLLHNSGLFQLISILLRPRRWAGPTTSVCGRSKAESTCDMQRM